MCAWEEAEFFGPGLGLRDYSSQVRGGASSRRPLVRGGMSFPKCEGQLSYRNRDNFPCWGPDSEHLSAMPSVLAGASDVDADPDCGGTTDPGIGHQQQFDTEDTVAAQATKVGMVPVET